MKWRDRPLTRGMWLATCLVIGALLAVFTIMWTSAAVDSHDAKTAATRQAEGRSIAIDVLCGFSNGVADAGRRALAGKLKGQHGHGLPQKAQDDYVSIVNQRLIVQRGVRAKDVLIRSGPNVGLIDCRRLRVAAKVAHP